MKDSILQELQTILIIGTVVSGGKADEDGQLAPNDKIISINGINMDQGSQEFAVQVLKNAGKSVKIVVARQPCGDDEVRTRLYGGGFSHWHGIRICACLLGCYFTKIGIAIGGFSSEMKEPKLHKLGVFWAHYGKKHPIWAKLGVFLSKMVWWMANCAKSYHRESPNFRGPADTFTYNLAKVPSPEAISHILTKMAPVAVFSFFGPIILALCIKSVTVLIFC